MPSFIKNKKYKKDLLEKVKQDVMISQKEIKTLENKVGLTSKEVKEINRSMSMGETKMRRAKKDMVCLLYTSPSPRDGRISRMPSSA